MPVRRASSTCVSPRLSRAALTFMPKITFSGYFGLSDSGQDVDRQAIDDRHAGHNELDTSRKPARLELVLGGGTPWSAGIGHAVLGPSLPSLSGFAPMWTFDRVLC